MPFELNTLLGVVFETDQTGRITSLESSGATQGSTQLTFQVNDNNFQGGGRTQVIAVDDTYLPGRIGPRGYYYLPSFGRLSLSGASGAYDRYIFGFSENGLLLLASPDVTLQETQQPTYGQGIPAIGSYNSGTTVLFTTDERFGQITFDRDPSDLLPPDTPAPVNPFDVSVLNGVTFPDGPIAVRANLVDADGVTQAPNSIQINGLAAGAAQSGVGSIEVLNSVYRPGYTDYFGQYILPTFGEIRITPSDSLYNSGEQPSGEFFIHGFGNDGNSLFISSSRKIVSQAGSYGYAYGGASIFNDVNTPSFFIDLDGFNGQATFNNDPAVIDQFEDAVPAPPAQGFDINDLLGVHFTYDKVIAPGAVDLGDDQVEGFPITFDPANLSNDFFQDGGQVKTVDASTARAGYTANGKYYLPVFGSFTLDDPTSLAVFYIVGFSDDALLTVRNNPKISVLAASTGNQIENGGVQIFFSGQEHSSDPITFTNDSTPYVPPATPPANPFDINVLNGIYIPDQPLVYSNVEFPFIDTSGVVQQPNSFTVNGPTDPAIASGLGAITVRDNIYRPGYTNSFGEYVMPSFGRISIAALPEDSYYGDPIPVPGVLNPLNGAPSGTFYVHGFGDDGASLFLTGAKDVLGGGEGAPRQTVIIDLDGFNGPVTFTNAPANIDNVEAAFAAVCFAEGTMIDTPAGPVAVEDLVEGGAVLTASGAVRPIRWIGAMTARPAYHPRPNEVNPVRVKAGAFGERLPRRDVRLSPGHAVFVDGVLVPVGQLVNGATIVQEEVARIRYFHVELDTHDVLLAEGLPCESYLDDGNRATFANADAVTDLNGRLDPMSWDDACAPLVAAGPQLGEVRQRLHARAEALGWVRSEEPELRLTVDGAEVMPLRREGGRYWFALPAGGAVTLSSNAGVLAQTMPGAADTRRLGVAVAELRIDGAAVALDDAAFGAGFHPVERQGDAAWRWTDGAALLARPAGAATVEIALAMVAPSWVRPVPTLRIAA